MQFFSILGILVLALSCTLAADISLNPEWKLWKEANNKHYSDAEEHRRYETEFSIDRFH